MSNTIKLGNIGEGAAAAFDAMLEQCDPTKELYIDMHSEGGIVFEGFRIANAVEAWPGKVIGRVKVAAFSIASYIAMKCDEIEIAQNGFFMIHNPHVEVQGDDDVLTQNAEILADMKKELIAAYSAKTGMAPDEVAAVMKKETFFSAQKSIDAGLADRMIEPVKKNAPEHKNTMPSFVFAAMYAAGEAEPAATPKEKGNGMSQEPTKPVAASAKEIEAKFPKASAEFKFRAMTEEMALEDVGEEYAKAMEEENEELKAQLKAMGEELEAMKVKAEAEPEEEPVAKGTTPVAQGSIEGPQATMTWDEAVQSFKAKGHDGAKAAILANRKFPGLRQQLFSN